MDDSVSKLPEHDHHGFTDYTDKTKFQRRGTERQRGQRIEFLLEELNSSSYSLLCISAPLPLCVSIPSVNP
jgi:hypothetical protein